MGTYTTNKNLFMPTVGEQGWGELVNGNFETIDNFLKPITVSGSTYTFTGNQTGGSISATSINNSGTLTQTGTSTFTGKITANGGIGTKALTATSISNSGNMTNTGTLTSTGKIYANGGLEITGNVNGNVIGNVTGNVNGNVYVNITSDSNYTIGSYTVTPNQTSVSATYNQYGKGTYGAVSLTINNVSLSMKKGFVQNSIPKVKITATLSFSAGAAFTNQTLYMYCNDVQVASYEFPSNSSSSGSCSATIYVSQGDTISGNLYRSKSLGSNWSSTNTLTLSNLSNKLYLA